jgi:DUF1680 family protein
VDAARGCLAIERGPLVYCLEAVDNPGQRLDDLVLEPDREPSLVRDPARLDGVPLIQAWGRVRTRSTTSWWPYASAAGRDQSAGPETIPLTAVPYFTWGNRERGAMRVWIPAYA